MSGTERRESTYGHPALDLFGAFLMQRVRDVVIPLIDHQLEAERQAPGISRQGYEQIATFTPEQLDFVHRLVPDIVDKTMHYLLWALDETEAIDIAVHTAEGDVPSLREISDGLYGESYGPAGWIKRYSRQRVSPSSV